MRSQMAGLIPAAALSSATLGKLSHTNLPLLQSSIIRYLVGSKQAHRAAHWFRVHSFGWCLAEYRGIEDERHHTMMKVNLCSVLS